MLYQTGEHVLIAEMRSQLKRLVEKYQCKVLAIDMTPVGLLPSSLLGLLVSLYKGGLKIEMLHPSEPVRQLLERTKLNRILVIRDQAR
jgi:hypothetical protein